MLTEHPDTKVRNLGVYRMHVFDAKTTGMHWQIGKGGGFHFHAAEKRGDGLPVAVAVGADPATLLASVAPLPEGVDELAFAGFLRGAPTRLAPATKLRMARAGGRRVRHRGLVQAGERHLEGPFGDHFGHYSHAADFPVFHVRDVTHRARPVFQASVVGKPPQEDKFMGEAVQEMFTGVLRVLHPEIRDLWAYFEAGFHNLLVVAVENRFAKEAKKTALGLMGTGQLSLTKVIVLVDAGVDPRDRAAVFGALARNFDPAEDLILRARRAARHARFHLLHHEPGQQAGAGRAGAAGPAGGGAARDRRGPAGVRRADRRVAAGLGRAAGGAAEGRRGRPRGASRRSCAAPTTRP